MSLLDLAPLAGYLRCDGRRLFARISEAQENDHDEFWLFPAHFGGELWFGVKYNSAKPDVFVDLGLARRVKIEIVEDFGRARFPNQLMLEGEIFLH